MGNLPHVQLLPEFRTANAGFLYDFQLINVEDFHGMGESEPNPYFYQVNNAYHYLLNQQHFSDSYIMKTEELIIYPCTLLWWDKICLTNFMVLSCKNSNSVSPLHAHIIQLQHSENVIWDDVFSQCYCHGSNRCNYMAGIKIGYKYINSINNKGYFS